MKKKFTGKDYIIVFLLLALASTLAFTLWALHRPEGDKFIGPLDEAVAIKNVAKFRATITIPAKKSFGVYYDSTEIRFYLDSIYPRIKATIGAMTPPAGYMWKVGFYWMMTKDKLDKITKHDFCVMPVLVSMTDPKDVIDYYIDTKGMYQHPADSLLKLTGGNAYDEGQLWP